jgi:hypothetical protein
MICFSALLLHIWLDAIALICKTINSDLSLFPWGFDLNNCADRVLSKSDQSRPLHLAPTATLFQLARESHLLELIHAASFRSLISVRASVDDCGVLWSRSSPSRKLISPPSRMAKPEK